MNENVKKAISYIAVFAIAGIIGFFVGRSTIKERTVTETVYLPGDTVTIHKDSLVPVYVNRPVDTANVLISAISSGKFTDLFPVRDSIVYVTKEDTAAVLLDWAAERFYEETLFDIDTVGTEKVKLKVQYNRLDWINGTFSPVVKNTVVTKVKTKKFSPFVGAGITTMPEVVVNGGIFFEEKYGAMLMYEYNWEIKKQAAGATFLYRF